MFSILNYVPMPIWEALKWIVVVAVLYIFIKKLILFILSTTGDKK